MAHIKDLSALKDLDQEIGIDYMSGMCKLPIGKVSYLCTYYTLRVTQPLFYGFLILFLPRFVVHKHLHGFVQDTDGGSMPGAGGDTQRRGHLDIVGLQFDGKQSGRQLPPGVIAKVLQALLCFVGFACIFLTPVRVHVCMFASCGRVHLVDATTRPCRATTLHLPLPKGVVFRLLFSVVPRHTIKKEQL